MSRPSFLRLRGAAVHLSVATVASLTFAAAPSGHYTLSADTALDARTRLEWARQPGAARVSLADALLACNNRPGGLWRVPSARELETIVDVRAATAPTWDRTAFGQTSADPPVFWTLTPLPVSSPPLTHVVVDFRPTRLVSAQAETELALVRCVRGPQ